MSTDRLNVSVADGKYTVIQRQEGTAHILRHGEPWALYPEGKTIPNVTLALAYEVQELRDRLKTAGLDE